jgi:TPR repeat protein
MPTFRSLAFALSLSLAALADAPTTYAFDPTAVFNDDSEPRTVLRYGYEALKGGRVDDAVGAFTYGAEHDNIAAEWKLARMFEAGDGVAVDPKTAHDLYSRLVRRYAEQVPEQMERPFVSAALVSLADFALTGVEGAVRRDPRRAEHLLFRAAALYQDAEAQYRLGALYQSDSLGAPQMRNAARWYGLAAKKGHAGALARLGRMLMLGDGIPRRPVRGLVMLTRAKAASANSGITVWFKEALEQTTMQEREQAAHQLISEGFAKQDHQFSLSATPEADLN